MGDSAFGIVAIIVLVVVFFITAGNLHTNGQSQLGYQTAAPTSPSAISASDTIAPVATTTSPYSPFAGKIRLGYGNPASQDVDTEYLEVAAMYSNMAPVDITGWRLVSTVTGQTITIGYGSSLPELGGIASEDIVLKPNDYAYVIAGRSPEGLSFRDNECTGYFAQSARFYPGVSGGCPRPAQPAYQSIYNASGLPVDCEDYINSVPSCSIDPTVPQRYATCADYVDTHFSYQGCVADFKNDPNFYLNHWFVYENRSQPIWRQTHETVVLYDLAGKVVDSFSY